MNVFILKHSNILFLFVFVFLLACSSSLPQVTLQAPNSSAPVEARIDAYQKLKPKHYLNYEGERVRTTKSMALANGVIVYRGNDLLSVVPKDSIAAQYGTWEEKHLRRRRFWGTVSIISALFATTTIFFEEPFFQREDKISNVAIPVGTTLLWVGSMIPFYISSNLVAKSREQAFEHFDSSLKQYLNLCHLDEANNNNVVGCEELSIETKVLESNSNYPLTPDIK